MGQFVILDLICRCAGAGTVTSWYFGESEDLLRGYAWYVANADMKPQSDAPESKTDGRPVLSELKLKRPDTESGQSKKGRN